MATVALFLVFSWAVFDPDRLAIEWLALPGLVFVGLVVAQRHAAEAGSWGATVVELAPAPSPGARD